MINRAILVGRLTRDPDLRYTASGAAVATFTVAVNRQFTNQLVGIDGRIQTRSYEKQQGTRVYVTEVVAENFSLLESRAEADRYREQHGMTQNNYGNNAPSQNQASQFDSNPFGDSQSNNSFGGNTPANNGADNSADPFADNGQSIDISDDDLPF